MLQLLVQLFELAGSIKAGTGTEAARRSGAGLLVTVVVVGVVDVISE
jgi:hypothetical protein